MWCKSQTWQRRGRAYSSRSACRAQIDWDNPPGEVSSHLKELVHKCLKPDWKDRPTCVEISAWLDELGAAA